MRHQHAGTAAAEAEAPRRQIAAAATDPEQGLTAGQAAERAAAGTPTSRWRPLTKTELQIVRDNVFTFFNLIFVVLAVCLLFVGDFRICSFWSSPWPIRSSASSRKSAPSAPSTS